MVEYDPERQAIADVYGEALFSAAVDQGQEDQVASEFADVIAYMDKDPDFAAFMSAESVDDDPRRLSLEKLFRGRMNDLLLNLFQVLNNHFRSSLVRYVQRSMELLMREKNQQQEVVVETASPLTAELKEAICNDVSTQTGKQAILVEKVKPELIGGLVIRIGDLEIDGSVTTRMQNMQKQLYDRASEAVIDGRGY
ncbi:MAG: ATP synthase F1 subunit delta [Planctomycetota bacterium]|jgi:F-type H+-transporting ATPase subunit delta